MASSISLPPSIPNLSFPFEKQKVEGNIISRSESHQPPATSTVREYSPKKSMSTYSFSTSINQEDKERAISILQQSLGEYFRAVISSTATRDGIVLVHRRGTRSGIGYRNLITEKSQTRIDDYLNRGHKTLWKIIETIQNYIDLGQSSFTYKTKRGDLATEHVFTLIKNVLNIATFREFANQPGSELLRYKIVKCFYKVMAGELEVRCGDVLELIVGISKIPLIEGLSLLRTLAVKKYLEADPDGVIQNPITFFAYDALFSSADPEVVASYQTKLIQDSSLLLSFDGEKLETTTTFFRKFQMSIMQIREAMSNTKLREQGLIAREENLMVRVSLQINCGNIRRELEKFDTMFRNYIETNLKFLEIHFRSQFSTDLKSFRERLNAALLFPYNRYELINLATLLNYVVWNVLQKHNVVQKEGVQMNIVGTPRKILSI